MKKILSIVFICGFTFLLSSCGGGSTGATGATGPAGAVSSSSSATPNVFYSFQGGTLSAAYPTGKLIQGSDGYLYGISSSGGSNNYGAFFKVSTTGVETIIYSFTSYNYGNSSITQGADGNFYGTSSYGGTSNNYGIVFKISPTGTFTTLYTFTGGTNGSYPYSGVIQGSDGYLYGTTSSGGTNSYGTVFKISTTGTLTSLYSFTGGTSDGCSPYSGFIQGSDGYLYGTTNGCGTYSRGVIYRISTAGVETVLRSFVSGTDGYPGYYGYSGNADSSLVMAKDGNLYGVNSNGGLYGSGTVFKLTNSGTFTTLYSFGNSSSGVGAPVALIQGADGYLYGTTTSGSYYSNNNSNYYYDSGAIGTVFKISTSGIYTSLYSLQYGVSGSTPSGIMQASDGYFYGLAQAGVYGNGTIFKF